MRKKKITTKELDKKFNAGEDISEHLDIGSARRPNRESRRITLDVPEWMLKRLDSEARKLGIPRQAVIKTWLNDRIEA